MNKILARRLKKYYKQINSAIPKDYPNKNQIFNSIKSDIAAYLTDNPEISIEHIESHFGTPTEVACSFIESLSTSQVLSSIRQKRKKNVIILAISSVIICILIIFIFYLLISTAVEIQDTTYIYVETIIH